jgi:hypothetical protein
MYNIRRSEDRSLVAKVESESQTSAVTRFLKACSLKAEVSHLYYAEETTHETYNDERIH